MSTRPWSSSAWTSAKHWPTRARLFISPSTWVPTSPSPWTPGVRQWMALWKRRRAPLLRGEMPGEEKNSSARRGKPLQLWRCFPVTIVTTQMFLKRGWGNIKGWSMENPSWTLSYNPLLPPLPRCWESQLVTVMHWLCPQLETQLGSSLAAIVMKTCLQTTSVQLTLVADVRKYSAVSRNWPITKELFTQTYVMYASNSLLTRIPFLHIFGKNIWTIENDIILLKWWPICLLGRRHLQHYSNSMILILYLPMSPK